MYFDENTRFTAAAEETPRLRRFQDEAVVFSPASGDTHLLAGPVVAILEAIIEDDKTYLAIRDLFLKQSSVELRKSCGEKYLVQALSELARLDLISVAGASEA